MTPEQIEKLSEDEVLKLMRSLKLPVEHSLFATIHHRSDERPDGFDDAELDEISQTLESADLKRWRSELVAHFAGTGKA